MLDKKSLHRIGKTVRHVERNVSIGESGRPTQPNDQSFARIKVFEGPEPATWENVSGDKWKLEGCFPVRRTTGTWEKRSNASTQTIWFLPEMFGADDQADPNDLLLSKWLACVWQFESKRWLVMSANTIDQTGTTTTGDDGTFTCCQCTNSKLWVELENSSTLDVAKISFPKSIVSSGSIVHKIRVTCKADGETLDITLPSLDCESEDCQTHDLTGTSVGGCDVGLIYFGNSSVCTTSTGCLAPESSTAATGSSDGAKYHLTPAVVGASLAGWAAIEFQVTYAQLASGTNPRIAINFPSNAHQVIHFFGSGTTFDGGTGWAATTGSSTTTWTAGDVAKMRIERINSDPSTDEFKVTLYKNGVSFWTGDTDSVTVTTPIDTTLGFCGAGGTALDAIPTTTQFTTASNTMKY